MQNIIFDCGPLNTMCYLLINDDRDAVLIDAAPESYEKVIAAKAKNNFNLKAVLLTHGHWDHATDSAIFQREFKIPIYIDKGDIERMRKPNENTIWKLPFVIEACEPDHLVEDNEILKFGKFEFKVLKTPGHSAGSVSYVLESEHSVFCGDTIFRESIGRTDFEDGDYRAIKDSIMNKLYKLPDDFAAYPGHGIPTEIGYEKKYNSYIRIDK